MGNTVFQEQSRNQNKELDQAYMPDSAPEEDYNNLVSLAASACETPVAFLAFMNENRLWFKTSIGSDIKECSIPELLADSLPTIGQEIIVNDLLSDGRFNIEPFSELLPRIRFWAAMPIEGEPNTIVGYLMVADDKVRDLSAHQRSCFKMIAGQITTLLALKTQIHKLKKIEQDYKSGDEQMNTIFQNAIDAVIVIDENGAIVQWNPKAETIFGWKLDSIKGKIFQDTLLLPKCVDTYLNAMQQFRSGGKGSDTNSTIELTAVRKNKKEFEVAIGISPTTINGKRFFINFVSDITDRKLATYNLDKQKEFYENILNQLPTDIAVFDANHKYLFVNPGAIKDEELRKYIVGKDDFQYAEYRNRDKSVAQRRRDQFLEVKNGGKEIRWEDNSVMDPDGNPITHLRRLFPVFDGDGNLSMVIGFGIDITDRKHMEIKQTALVKQLSDQNTQLVDFCNIVSHNLRAPLVNMSMLVDFIRESMDPEEQSLLITKLKPVLDNLHTTFNELVESIQIKQDLEIKYEKNNLEHCLQRTIDGLKTEISKSDAKVEFNFENASTIYCPSKYLFSIFHNLVSNSLKYQSPKRKPVIRIETKKHNGKITLSVCDNGLGIDMNKHKNNIFKIGKVFHRHPNAKGFGLFMTKTHVEAMEGKIWVESTPGEGSTFFIEFKNQK